MTNELVSALLDGECSSLELRCLLDSATESPELMRQSMRQWGRMNLVREALAGNPVRSYSKLDPDQFCAGIMSQLGEMESIDAPLPTPLVSKVVPIFARQRQAAPRRSRRTRPLVGWAAAASVTVVALAGGRAWLGSEATPTPGVVASNSINDVRSASASGSGHFGLAPVSVHTYLSSAGTSAELHWSQFSSEIASRGAGDLLGQNRFSLGQGMDVAESLGSSAVYETVSVQH